MRTARPNAIKVSCGPSQQLHRSPGDYTSGCFTLIVRARLLHRFVMKQRHIVEGS
jgi:hypothetical protein